MSDTAVSPMDRPAITARSSRRSAVAGGVGSLIEWYDYGLYGLASALYITPLFFSGSSPFVGSLLTFGTFAVGFAARPLGGFVLGHLGDRWGRKPVLLLSVTLMGVSTALMGLLPTTDTAGLLAPALLVVLRLVQGFGAGAELAGAFVYVAESTRPARRGFYSSFPAASIPVGAVLSSGLFLWLQTSLTDEAMMSWGWRVPFLVSFIGLIVALIVRSRLEEAPEFEQRKRAGGRVRTPLLEMFRADPRAFAAGLLAPTVVGVGFYVTSVFGINYVTKNLGVPSGTTLTASFILSVTAIFTILWAGHLSDRFGAHRVFLFGSVFTMVFAFPFFLLLQTADPVAITVALVVNYAIGWGSVAAAQGRFLPSLFSTEHRFSGVAVTREINSAALAGPAPLIAVALVGAMNGQPWLVAAMLIVAGLLSVAGVLLGWHRAVADATEGASR